MPLDGLTGFRYADQFAASNERLILRHAWKELEGRHRSSASFDIPTIARPEMMLEKRIPSARLRAFSQRSRRTPSNSAALPGDLCAYRSTHIYRVSRCTLRVRSPEGKFSKFPMRQASSSATLSRGTIASQRRLQDVAALQSSWKVGQPNQSRSCGLPLGPRFRRANSTVPRNSEYDSRRTSKVSRLLQA